MPFTLAHPAAIVPLARRGLSFSALAVGSMAPDFPYFILPSEKSNFSHSPIGGFVAGIPIGLLVLWVFHAFLKFPLLSLLSKHHQERLAPYANAFRLRGARDFGLIFASLAIGIFTHLAWDYSTHYYGWYLFYQRWHWPFGLILAIDQPVIRTSGGPIFLFDIFQYGSSVLGLVLLVFWYFRWLRKAQPQPIALPFHLPELSRRLILHSSWGSVLIIGLASVMLKLNFAAPNPFAVGFQGVIRTTAVLLVKVPIVEVLLFSLWWHWAASRQRTRDKRAH